jgi:FkbH-like protein/thioester reductase-like protein
MYVEQGDLYNKVYSHSSIDTQLRYVELFEASEEEGVDAAKKLFKEEHGEITNLDKELPWRATLCKIGDGKHILMVVAHHIISDFVSVFNIFQEIQYFHELEIGGTPSPLALQFISDEAAHEKKLQKEKECAERCGESTRKALEGAAPLKLHQRGAVASSRTFEAGTEVFAIPKEVVEQIAQLAKDHHLSPPVIYLSAFQMAISSMGNQEDFLLGLATDGRTEKANRGAFGFLSSPSMIRSKVDGGVSVKELFEANQVELRKSLKRRHLPLSEIYSRGGPTLAPLQVLFSYLEHIRTDNQGSQTELIRLYEGVPYTDLELWCSVQRGEIGTFLQVDYAKELFTKEEIEDFFTLFLKILRAMAKKPSRAIAEVFKEVGRGLEGEGDPLLLSGSFSLEPLVDEVERWGKRIGLDLEPQLAPYQQVVQSLLSPGNGRKDGSFVLFLRLSDFFRAKGGVPEAEEVADVRLEILKALTTAVERRGVVHQVFLCPDRAEEGVWKAESDLLARRLAHLPGVHLVDLTGRSDPAIYQPESDKAAHIPYTNGYYRQLAEQGVKVFYHLNTTPVKVLALDCDNTLWEGVVGEEGVEGVKVTKAHRQLQERVCALQEEGVLVVLVSKNNEEEVLTFLREHPDMVLREEHLVSHRINWNSKGENIASLAEELNLGLDAFVFIDDNPVEIAGVESTLPEVLCLQVPKEAEALARWVENMWIFDPPLRAQGKRLNRTLLYQQEAKRKAYREGSGDLVSYIEGLQFELTLDAMTDETLARSSELTKRTNQFTMTGERWGEAELKSYGEEPGRDIITLSASDRFGDYGQIGLLLLKEQGEVLQVDHLMISCRVLGRGLEVQLLSWLAKRAEERGLTEICFRAVETGRNIPAIRFLSSLSDVINAGGELCVTLPPEKALHLTHKDFLQEGGKKERPLKGRPTMRCRIREGRALTSIANMVRGKGVVEEVAIASSSIRDQLYDCWSKVLPQAVIDDESDFFLIGGCSLNAVELLIKINGTLSCELTISDLYQYSPFQTQLALIEEKLAMSHGDEGDLHTQVLCDIELSYEDVPLKEVVPPQGVKSHSVLFLTGATGFVGGHILVDLLKQGGVKVVCLVRGEDGEDARRRLEGALQKNRLQLPEGAWDAIEVVQGDFSKKRLGLAGDVWDVLTDRIDRIIHCGANVNFFDSYANLKLANVESTRELLKMCGKKPAIHLNFISTTGVFVNQELLHLKVCPESLATGTPFRLSTGYQQTKWVSEKLISRAQERGYNANIIRLGVVAGNSKTGAINTMDLQVNLMAGIHSMGAMPEMRNIDFLPVEFVSKAIIALSQRTTATGQIFHLVHPKPLPIKTFKGWYDLAGYELKKLSYQEWQGVKDRFFEKNPGHHFAMYDPLLNGDGETPSFLEVLLKSPAMDATVTQAALEEEGLSYPSLNQEMFSRYLDTFKEYDLVAKEPSLRDGETNWLIRFPEAMDGYVSPWEGGPLTDGDYAAGFFEGQEVGRSIKTQFVAHIDNIPQVMDERKVYLSGEVILEGEAPLTVEKGVMELLPFRGYEPGRNDSFIFLTYRVDLVGVDGQRYQMDGYKVSKEFGNIFSEVVTLNISLKGVGGQAAPLIGQVSMPFERFFRAQFTSMEFRSGTTAKEQQKYRALWLLLLSAPLLRNYFNLYSRSNLFEWADIREILEEFEYVNTLKDRIKSVAPFLNRLGILSNIFEEDKRS